MTSYVYLQPHTALAENIISHRVTSSHFLEILRLYGHESAVDIDIDTLTRYYQSDMILEVNSAGHKWCYTNTIHGAPAIYGNFELVYSNIYEIPVMHFPLDKHFHHERQAIVLTIPLDPNATLIMEILISGIKRRPKYDIEAVIGLITSDIEVISLSFRVVVQKANELNKYIEIFRPRC